jgi:hypothetical protein
VGGRVEMTDVGKVEMTDVVEMTNVGKVEMTNGEGGMTRGGPPCPAVGRNEYDFL